MEGTRWEPEVDASKTAEGRIISAILDGRFPAGSNLPAERELAVRLGITRPTLRETLQRLARDGWIEIHHGKPTRVRDYWQEGSLGVLGAIVSYSREFPADFVTHLLVVRGALAPAYTRLAVEMNPGAVQELLENTTQVEEQPEAFARVDWDLHYRLTLASKNPIFTLILNGFRDFYHRAACIYFQPAQSRASSRAFYQALLSAVQQSDPQSAEEITRQVMDDSLVLWQAAARAMGKGR